MSALDTATRSMDGIVNSAHASAVQLKDTGVLGGLISGDSTGSLFSHQREQGANRQRYGLFRGWLYSAINAICMEGAGQPAHVGRVVHEVVDEEERSRLSRIKDYHARLMLSSAKHIVANNDIEVDPEHPFNHVLETPNPIQHRWQFVYNFIANLCLTGWSFVLSDGDELYSLPTTWIQPDHKEGPFSRFKIRDPRDPEFSDSDDDWFTREQVDFAYLPNPSNPLSALAPASSQHVSIRIDDHIQTSQEQFFHNGIFPGVIVTVGKDPHPEVAAAFRPRLTSKQRRQVHAAIHKVMGGVANYGAPAIVDGLIENITRLSATQNEMGWDKSEDKIRARILSAFGVHPYVLGEAVNVGGYAQAAKIEERFCKKVNTYLDMIGTVVTNLAPDPELVVWWEKCEPHDPDQERRWWETGVKNNHIKRNEFRAKLSLPPLEEEDERNPLLESVGGMTGAINLFQALGNGVVNSDQVARLLTLFFQVEDGEAREIVGNPEEAVAIEEAVAALSLALEEMKKPVRVEVDNSRFSKQLTAPKPFDSSDLERQLSELQQEFNIEKVRRESGQKEILHATRLAQGSITESVTKSLLDLETLARTQQDSQQLAEGVKAAFNQIGETLTRSLSTIEEAVKQPTLVNVHNEVHPTPIEVTNNVPIPEVTINNDVQPTEVVVRNEVQTPEVNVEVRPEIDIQPPEVTVHNEVQTPEINLEPRIVVESPEVEVNLEPTKPVSRATVTHPDGSISQVQIQRENN